MKTEFSHDQYALAYPQGVEYHWWNRARSSLIAQLVQANTVAGDAGNKVVEVGCGRGLEVKALLREGIDAVGVELAPVEALPEVAQNIFTGTDACELPDTIRMQATTLLLLDVLEHLPEPQAFLESLSISFPNLDVVIVTVPAGPELWSNYDEFYGHQRRYTRAKLNTLAADVGWRAQRVGYFFHLLYLPTRLLSLMGVSRGTKISAPKPGMRWLHAIVAGVCRLEFLLLPESFKGTSAFAVYRTDRKN